VSAQGSRSPESMVAGESPARGSDADSTAAEQGCPHETDSAPGSLARVKSPLPLAPRVRRGIERREWVRGWRELREIEPGLTLRRGAAALGVPMSTLRRVLDRAERLDRGGQALDAGALENRRPPGRPARVDVGEIALGNEEFRRTLEACYAATIGAANESSGHGRRTGSVSLALAWMAEEEVACPECLRNALRGGRQPRSLVRHLRSRFTPEVEARVRGERNFQLHGLVSRRDHTLRLPDGSRVLPRAGLMWELDDMSVNQPFWVPAPAGGWIMSRQGLYCRDLHARRWLGVELVARPREAYRAEDILRFLRRQMLEYGRPDMLRLEQGIWAARSIKGWAPSGEGEPEARDVERAGMSEEDRQRLQDGIEAIGVMVDWATDAHVKTIEGAFDHLQDVVAVVTRDFLNIGRHAGEFEVAAKRLRQAREGRDPGALGFAPMDVLADRIARAFRFINGRASAGAVPDEVWAAGMAARPLPVLRPDQLAVFLPEKRDRTIEGGRIVCRVDGRALDFRAVEFAELGHGYQVYAKFDPSEPQLGCAVYNRDRSSRNLRGWGDGDWICWAAYECPGPQAEIERCPAGLELTTTLELYGVEEAEDVRTSVRNGQEKWCRTAYRSVPKSGKPAVRVAEERDGRGLVSRVERGQGAIADSQSAIAQGQIRNPKSEIRNPMSDRRAPVRTRASVEEFIGLDGRGKEISELEGGEIRDPRSEIVNPALAAIEELC